MKPASVKQLKDELKFKSKEELLEVCLRLVKFKKENKELLSYLLFDALDENQFVKDLKADIDVAFSEINTSSNFYVKKSVRKVLREIKKNCKFTSKKRTEIELHMHFCKNLNLLKIPLKESVALQNILLRQKDFIQSKISALHEDLQFDYQEEFEALNH